MEKGIEEYAVRNSEITVKFHNGAMLLLMRKEGSKAKATHILFYKDGLLEASMTIMPGNTPEQDITSQFWTRGTTTMKELTDYCVKAAEIDALPEEQRIKT